MAVTKRYSPFRRRQRRLLLLGIVLPAFFCATVLALMAISRTQVYFYGPSALPNYAELDGREVRLGGLVEEGTLKAGTDTKVAFTVTDRLKSVPVIYDDALPSLVAEGDGIVVQGTLGPDGVFIANNVMARHDENYIAPEVADALKESGQYEEYIKNRRQD